MVDKMSEASSLDVIHSNDDRCNMFCRQTSSGWNISEIFLLHRSLCFHESRGYQARRMKQKYVGMVWVDFITLGSTVFQTGFYCKRFG